MNDTRLNRLHAAGLALGVLGMLWGCSREEPASDAASSPPEPAPASSPASRNGADEGEATPAQQPEPPEQRESSAPAEAFGELAYEVDIQPATTIKRDPADEAMVMSVGRVRGLQYLIPTGWITEAPDNPMREAQIRLAPPPQSDFDPGVVTMMGGVGGSVYDNINRWLGQFEEFYRTPVMREIDFGEGDPLLVIELVVVGTMRGGAPGGPAERTADMTLMAAIIEGGPEGPVFIRALGPGATMEWHVRGWAFFVRNIKVAPPPLQRYR